MKKILLTNLIACLFIGAIWSCRSFAGPPEGMVRHMIPFPAMCLPSTAEENHFAVLVGALIQDYGVHISMTFSASKDRSRRVAIIENPAIGLAGVLMTTDKQTCIAFSGEDRKEFIRPPNHPIGESNMDPQA